MLSELTALMGWSPRTGTIRGGGYLNPITTGGVGWGIGANTSRYYLSANNESRIWMTGSLTAVRLYIGVKHADITAFYVSVWRKNVAGTYDLIGQEDVWPSLAASSITTVTLATPIAVVQGDYIGYGITASSTSGSYQTLGVGDQVAASTYYVSGATPDATGYAWESKMASAVLMPVVAYVSVAPSAVCIGDSLVAGHPANYSYAENSKTVDATSSPAALLQSMLGITNIANMGIGSQTTSTIAARIAADLTALTPRWAVLDGGVNDLIAGTVTQDTFLANWTTMLNACEAAAVIPIVLPILPWTNGTTEQMQTRDAWNAALETLVKSYPTALYASDAPTMLGLFRAAGDEGNLWDIQAAYDSDGVHLNAAGYAVLARAIVRAIARGRETALTAAYDKAKDDVLTPLAAVDGKADTLLTRATEARLAELDAANLPADVAAATAKVLDAAGVRGALGTGGDIDAKLDSILAASGGAIEDGVTITPATRVDDDGVIVADPLGTAIGVVMPYATIIAYIGNTAHYEFEADADGDYSFKLPTGSVWRIVASAPRYKTTSMQVSTVVA